jgi:hypothetical protein
MMTSTHRSFLNVEMMIHGRHPMSTGAVMGLVAGHLVALLSKKFGITSGQCHLGARGTYSRARSGDGATRGVQKLTIFSGE